ncbi:MAG TPA: fluoride efflux transporter CrcB [Gemmatimonadales bacterium]|jgi:crcB protein
MRNLLLVGGGGFLGSVARYYITGWATQVSHAGRFPVGTLAVNVTGCLLIGFLAGLAEHAHLLSPPTRLFLLTGFLGGYTTYSAFAYETYFLGREHLTLAALTSIALHLLLGLGAVLLGSRISALVGQTLLRSG